MTSGKDPQYDLLRNVVASIKHDEHDGSVLVGDAAVSWMTGAGLRHVRIDLATGARRGLDREGLVALDALAKQMIRPQPAYGRGATRAQFTDALAARIMEGFALTDAAGVADADAEAFASTFSTWWAANTRPITHLVPCAVIPYEADDFEVGAVRFVHWDRLRIEDHGVPADHPAAEMVREDLVRALNAASACWVAIVTVEGALPARAEQLADLAIDVALTGVQLAVPVGYSRSMARVTSRTTPAFRGRVAISDANIGMGTANRSPGLALSGPAFTGMLVDSADLLKAVGRRLAAFVGGPPGKLAQLDQAWCDGAYWFHEGLAETLDSIAVAKLETAIEVMLRAESSKGSAKRIRQAVRAVAGLSEYAPIAPGSTVTVHAFAKAMVGARSQVLHGIYSTLNIDLSSERVSLEMLAFSLLAKMAVAIDAYAATTRIGGSVDSLLAWLVANEEAE